MFLAVYGDDALRVREFVHDLQEKFIIKYDPARMNVDIVSWSDRDAVVGALQAAPFLAERRFVILKHAAREIKKADKEFMESLFSRVHETISVCFVDEVSEDNWQKSVLGTWFTLLSPDMGRRFPIPPLTARDRIAWVRVRAERAGLVMRLEHAEQLVARVGDDSFDLSHEIGKLAAYCLDTPLTDSVIRALVPLRSEGDVFAFFDALTTQKPERILALFQEEVASGADMFAFLGAFVRQIWIWASVARLMHEGVQVKQTIAETLVLHPFVTQKAMQAVRSFSERDLAELLERSLVWEREARRSSSPEEIILRMLTEVLKMRQ